MNHSPSLSVRGLVCGCLLLCTAPAWAQTALPLTDLSPFKPASKTWRIAGDVQADLAAANVLKTAGGTGVLVNLPTDKEHGQDLFTNLVHGDADVEFEYLMAKGSNSGLYLQGRYEIQLHDSWGKQRPYSGDNGGIYERWDDSKPEGQKGYEGHAPRQNVSKAPGLWQKMRISFQAPRFDASGKKIENARILSIQLNGVTIHENVELSGPTRGAMENNEVPQGPIRIQGDHGAVAFRNIKLMPFGKQQPSLKDLQYSVYQGQFEAPADVAKAKAAASGKLLQLSAAITTLANDFLIAYTGKLEVKEQGDYNFRLGVPGGKGYLKVGGKEVMPFSERGGTGSISLAPGEYPVEILYAKTANWAKPNIQLSVSGTGLRETLLSDPAAALGNLVDPILVEAPQNTMLRSFVDLPSGGRVTHAISIGSAEGLHYTYDLDNGTIVQAWRGSFLDATPMWHERGDGSSKPTGMVQYFGKTMPALAVLADANAAWKADSVGTGFRPKGYSVDKEDRPTFMYQIYGAQVQDAPRVSANGQELQRSITIDNAPANLYLRVAEGKDIREQSKGLYVVGDKELFIRIDDAGGATPLVRNGAGGTTELLLPVSKKAVYAILF
ncbi:protein of unknown function [Cnuella takakiae]|uniref:PA14 domain-containing protein n=1 Tax=Cnuella takakiae TaxID=1302690 RepID=A0A1M5G3Z5_9BACT|nr:DUF1080 domain-containing protein [Cnuella takakiae]OLY92323.1 hypothetical protein BUE76_10755 [Cnuella takakiae]SHF98364.1 protein of unknown function [Cnuella takakiae]